MKKAINYVVIIIVLISLFFLIKQMIFTNRLKDIGLNMEINTDSCKIEESKDTHGGVLGDGDYFAKIKCSKIPELSSNWKKLPLSSEIDKALSMKFCDGNGCKDTYEKYLIPKLESGYYYFFDRHDLANDINDDSELNNRSSWNFSVAIYDFEENIIYYYELDT
jgi:hypothetical protein